MKTKGIVKLERYGFKPRAGERVSTGETRLSNQDVNKDLSVGLKIV
jgi:hypothetical protein